MELSKYDEVDRPLILLLILWILILWMSILLLLLLLLFLSLRNGSLRMFCCTSEDEILNSYIFLPDIVFLIIDAFMYHQDDETMNGTTFAMDVPYLSVNLNKLTGPSIEQTSSLSWPPLFFTSAWSRCSLLLPPWTFLASALWFAFVCSRKLYINPRRLTFLRIFFQFAPPLTLNSSPVQVKSRVCNRDRLYHAKSSSEPSGLNSSRTIFSSRSLHNDCIIEVDVMFIFDAKSHSISSRRDSVSAKPRLADSSHINFLMSIGLTEIPRFSSRWLIVVLNWHLLSSRIESPLTSL
jgi:hypothetical protein